MPLTPCSTPNCPTRCSGGNAYCCHCRARMNKAPRRFHCDAQLQDGTTCGAACYGKNCKQHTAFTGNTCPFQRKNGSICGKNCRQEYCKYHRPEYVQRMRQLNADYKKAKRLQPGPLPVDV